MQTAIENPPSRRLRMPSINLVDSLSILGMAVALGMLALGVVMLLNARRDAWTQAELAANNLSIALERDIARNIAVYDLSILGAIHSLEIPGIDEVSPVIRQAAVFDKATSAAYLGSLLVADAAGNVTMDSQSLMPHPVSISDREHFRVQRERPDLGLFIGRPVSSRLDNQPVIALSRRINHADGHFAGAVIGGLRLAYFQDLFAKLYFGAKGSITLFRSDGRIIARYPYRVSDIDADLSQAATFKVIAASPSGRFVGKAELDHEKRFYTFRRVGDLPLILNIGVSVNEIYAASWRKATVIGSILAALCGATLALCVLFHREMRRRVTAESHLVKAAEELSALAATDGLTGLDNRRSFDKRLQQEWRRACRTGNPLCVIMIDADFFKLYNDSHGHQEGDHVLTSIAACIRQNTRNTDVAARYGGEEFIIVLPDTEIGGATQVAERIRGAIAKLAIPHGARPGGLVTVSMGVASTRPSGTEEAYALVKKADEALFDAKQAGRDRICPAREPSCGERMVAAR